jgi:cytidylate kinase
MVEQMFEKVELENWDMGKVITIDGPAASGKTSVSRELAKRLGWHWVSTGAFYRGLAFVAYKSQSDLTNESELAKLSQSTDWSVEMAESQTRVYFMGEDVTDQIGKEEVGNVASQISHFPAVRKSLLDGQRACQARTQGLVAEGRDCGTVVFPSAEVKIYITARSEDRAERRAKEQGLAAEDLLKVQNQRDLQDSTRKAAPLQIPENAFVVDSTGMSLNEVVGAVEAHVRKTLAQF